MTKNNEEKECTCINFDNYQRLLIHKYNYYFFLCPITFFFNNTFDCESEYKK